MSDDEALAELKDLAGQLRQQVATLVASWEAEVALLREIASCPQCAERVLERHRLTEPNGQ